MCKVSSLDYWLTSLAPNRWAGVDEYMIIHWKSGKFIVQNLCPEFLSPCMKCSCTQQNWTSLLPSCKIAVALTFPETKHPLLQKKKKTVAVLSQCTIHITHHWTKEPSDGWQVCVLMQGEACWQCMRTGTHLQPCYTYKIHRPKFSNAETTPVPRILTRIPILCSLVLWTQFYQCTVKHLKKHKTEKLQISVLLRSVYHSSNTLPVSNGTKTKKKMEGRQMHGCVSRYQGLQS
jgi:hypothetical protein